MRDEYHRTTGQAHEGRAARRQYESGGVLLRESHQSLGNTLIGQTWGLEFGV